jgi:hypothetical protein
MAARRRVFVLGRTAELDIADIVRRAAEDQVQLVLLSVGYPVDPAQDSVVSEAVRLADAEHVWLDAILVPSVRDLRRSLQDDDDDVSVVADGLERRTLERVVGPRRRRAPVAVPRYTTGVRQPTREAVVPSSGVAVEPAALAAIPRERAEEPSEPPISPGVVPSRGSESVEALTGREVPQPTVETVWTEGDARARKVGRLIVYLGAAPGVGKTYAMLGEGQRARARGTDVVVGIAETYGRRRTLEMLEGLEVIPPKRLTYRGTTFEEMDVEALIGRRPERALIDELAHTNIPGSRRAKRWEDVLDVLAEGITVITTLNVQHLASLNDVVAEVTGVRQQETVPDWILELADQVELVDMSPHALQRRMIHGNVYPDPRKAELALQRFFSTDNLTALRDLALMRVANQVDEELLRRWSKAGAVPDTRERILVCVANPAVSDELIRRGARVAQRSRGDLLVAHARAGGGEPDPDWIARTKWLAREVGGEFHLLPTDEEPVQTILSFAYQQHVTQILVWESLRSRWQELLSGSFVSKLIRQANNIDIHVIARSEQ